MKKIKWKIIILLLLAVMVFTFRGWIYRRIVTYKSVGPREKYSITNPTLKSMISKEMTNRNGTSITEIINASLLLTSKQLNFASSNTELDPNTLITSKAAHCVGYANFFTTACNHLIQENNHSEDWEAHSRKGRIYVFGLDIHTYFNTPFFKDHDFVFIENKNTGEVFAVDPTLHDYSGIKYVHYQ